jgi:UDP-N-acetyl-2-amino-2-deoxyglucuronate dehydrogenase
MIRFGLLGCRRIAKRHYDLLGANYIDGVGLVAVCDPVHDRAEDIVLRVLIPRSSC